MVNGRNGFTYIANITILTISLIFFIAFSNSTLQFTLLSLIAVSIGTISTLMYSINIKEEILTK